MLGDEKEIAAQNCTLARLPLDEVCEEKTHCEKSSKTLGRVWKNEDESAFTVSAERLG
jgi:hypothetical protein